MITSLPLELLTTSLLPLLDFLTLAQLAQTCTTMRAAVSDRLLTMKTLDMIAMSRWIERIANQGTAQYRKKTAFRFLTVNGTVSSLRKLKIGGNSTGKPMADLNTLKKVIRKNKNLEELSLVNMTVSNSLLEVIKELPKLKHLQIYLATDKNKVDKLKFYAMMKEMKKKGCTIYFDPPWYLPWSLSQ